MPSYRYVCPREHEFEVWRSITEPTVWELPCTACSRVATMHMASPAIAAEATPNKKHGVRALVQRDKRWSKDMDAYKRLRRNGVQPRGIDGSAEWEQTCNAPIELEMGKALGKEKDIRRAQEISSELLQQDFTKTGSEIGKAKRGTAA